MDLDPEGIFRDDSDEDEDTVQVRTGSSLRFFLLSPFYWSSVLKSNLTLLAAAAPHSSRVVDCLLGESGEGGEQGDGCLPCRRLAQNVHPCYHPGEAQLLYAT